MIYRVGAAVPASGIYWCTVCKTPEQLTAGDSFPECRNMCGRGSWEPVKQQAAQKDEQE